jgi:hypothetical protein
LNKVDLLIKSILVGAQGLRQKGEEKVREEVELITSNLFQDEVPERLNRIKMVSSDLAILLGIMSDVNNLVNKLNLTININDDVNGLDGLWSSFALTSFGSKSFEKEKEASEALVREVFSVIF